MDRRNLTTLFGPTLMKLSPKDKLEADNMAREITESTQQATVLFYIMKLHAQEKLVNYDKNENNNAVAAAAAGATNRTNETLNKDYNNNNKQSSRSSFFPILTNIQTSQQQTPKVQHNKQTAL